MKVLIGCEFSGIVREEFRKLGHNAWSCDLLDTEIPGQHLKMDIMDVLDDSWDILIAFPDCTYLTNAGARWFNGSGAVERFRNQQKALQFFEKLLCCRIKKKALENPARGAVSTYIRQPDQVIHPYEFGHGEIKPTGLWLIGLPFLQATNPVKGRDERILKEAPSKERWKNRSRTYLGIAQAMANQWGNNGTINQ